MIWNRPSNLWLGAITAIFNVIVFMLAESNTPIPSEVVAAVNLAFGAVITLIAGQAPTVNTNGEVHVKTGNDTPDKVITFNPEGFATTHVRE